MFGAGQAIVGEGSCWVASQTGRKEVWNMKHVDMEKESG